MNKHIQQIIEPFKQNKRFLTVFSYDSLFWIISYLLSYLFLLKLNEKAQLLDVGDVQSYLSSASEFQQQILLQNMKSFGLFFIFGVIILFIIIIVVYSLSRTFIWNYLLKKTFQRNKFIKLNFINILFFILLAIVFTLYSFFVNINVYIFTLLFYLAFIAMLYFSFLLYKSYTDTGLFIRSAEKAYEEFSRKTYLSAVLMFAAVFLLSILINLINLSYINNIISVTLMIVFTSWLSLFIVQKSL